MNVKERIEKIKNYIKENKKVYIGTATGVAIGVIGTLVYCLETGKFNKTLVVGQEGKDQLLCVGNNNKIVQSISKYGNKLGRPGKPVVNLETGKVYSSETLAALDAGVSIAMMSQHLRNWDVGKPKYDIHGAHYMFADTSDWLEY